MNYFITTTTCESDKHWIDSYGLEISLSRTAESFSLSDYMKWIQDIKYVLCKDWQEMKDKLRDIQYTSDSINKVYTTWERGGTGLAGKRISYFIHS